MFSKLASLIAVAVTIASEKRLSAIANTAADVRLGPPSIAISHIASASSTYM